MQSLFLSPVTEPEVVSYINSLKNNAAPGPDNITSGILKISKAYICGPLAHIINLSFEQGEFPIPLKKSIVEPIFKSGDPLIMGNYRPITLVSNVAKIFEKCLKDRILSHLNRNNIISKNQYGFKQNVSTLDAIHTVTSTIHTYLNNGLRPLAVFLDLAKAFDTVNHDLLLRKLGAYGIRGLGNDLIRSYLAQRFQQVRINSKLSEELEVGCGIPQGTVLGPILFQIYINTIFTLNVPGEIVSYADDTELIVADVTWDEARNRAETALQQISYWLRSNLLTLNTDKTKFLTFSLNITNSSYFNSLKVHNCNNTNTCGQCSNTISKVNDIKYLGIKIDQFLKWDAHVEMITNKLRKLIYKFYQLRQILNPPEIKLVYQSLVESILNYGIPIWGNAYETTLLPLQIVQKQIIKIMYNRPRLFSTDLLFKETKLFNLKSMYVYAAICFIKKSRIYSLINHDHVTRSNMLNQLVLPKPNNTAFLRSIAYTGIKLFNQLPLSIRNINNHKMFKLKVKLFVAENINTLKLN